MIQSDTDKAVICRFPISINDLQGNYERIIDCIAKDKGGWVVTLNLEMIYRAKTDEQYRSLLHKADFIIADGVPLLWASNLKKNTKRIAGRSNGTDLVEKLLSSGRQFRLGVIGGRNPGLVVDKYNPELVNEAYFYDGLVNIDDKKLINDLIIKLKENKINLLFLGLGVPKQDELALKICNHIDSIVVIGVGGSFDLLSGRKPRAPKWMQKNGLEWLYRLLTEPKRLAKRYLIHYPQALFFLVKDII